MVSDGVSGVTNPNRTARTETAQTVQQANSVVVNGVSFNLQTSNDGEGGSSGSGFGSDGLKGIPALIAASQGKNLTGLSRALALLGVTSVTVDEKGKLLDITFKHNSVIGNPRLMNAFLQNATEEEKEFLAQVFKVVEEKNDNHTANFYSNLKGILSIQDSFREQLIINIMKIAIDARSEVVEMIIKATEENRQMWIELLKQLAEKAFEKHQEAKAVLEKLMSLIVSGDESAARAVSAILASLGFSVEVTVPIQESFSKMITEDFKTELRQIAVSLDLNIDEPEITKERMEAFIEAVEAEAKSTKSPGERDYKKAKSIIDASVSDGNLLDYVGDLFIRMQLGI